MLLIDDRQGSRELVDHESIRTIEHRLCRLRSGDVSMLGNGPPETPVVRVGVEIKTFSEMVAAMDSGRLQATQYAHMVEDYDIRWLLVYGRYAERDGKLWTSDATGTYMAPYAGGKRKVPMSYPLACLHTGTLAGLHYHLVDDWDTAVHWLVNVLHNYWMREWRSHSSWRVFDKSRRGVPSGWREMLTESGDDEHTRWTAEAISAWTGVGLGRKRAFAAARHFGGLARAAGASVEEWMEVEGVGEATARRVVAAVGEKL